jgi:hypothetical protein
MLCKNSTRLLKIGINGRNANNPHQGWEHRFIPAKVRVGTKHQKTIQKIENQQVIWVCAPRKGNRPSKYILPQTLAL